MQNIKVQKKGFVILIAIMIATIILSITLGVLQISLKEINFSSSGLITEVAQIAADTGIECALFHDKYTGANAFPLTDLDIDINCNGSSVDPSFTSTATTASYDFVLSGIGNSSQACAKVNIFKDNTTPPMTTKITSKGYNIGDSFCNSTNPNRVERELVAFIGDSGTPSGTDLTVTLVGTGTGTVTSSPSGINCGADCSETYASGTPVTLNQVAGGSSTFAGWSGDADCSDGSVTVSGPVACTATFNLLSTINLVGSNSAGATTVVIPAHQAGDLIVLFAHNSTTSTNPTVPAGWTNLGVADGINNSATRLAYRVAAGSGTTSGTWTSATQLIVHVYRGQNVATPIGDYIRTRGSGTTVTYPGIVPLLNPDGSSWVAGFAGHKSTNTTLETSPPGMSNRISAAIGTGEASSHDTNGGVSSWSSQNVNVGGTSAEWKTRMVEIRSQ